MTTIRITPDVCTTALTSLVGAAAISQHDIEDVLGDFFGPDVNVTVDDGVELEALRCEEVDNEEVEVALRWKAGLPSVLVTASYRRERVTGSSFSTAVAHDSTLAFRSALSGDGEEVVDLDDLSVAPTPAERSALIEAARRASLDLRAALSRLALVSE